MTCIHESRDVQPRLRPLRSASGSGVVFFLASFWLLAATAAAQARDRTPPSKPGNFRVTAISPFSVSLAWSPSSDNSGNFSYLLASTAGGGNLTLPQGATTYTWSTGLYPRNSYTFILAARDAPGNGSASASVTSALPRDTLAPTLAPVLSVEAVGSTYATLSWSASSDDGPYLFYRVLVNGAPYADAGANLATTINLLSPETSYVVSVQARDFAGNLSPVSAPVTITTSAPNPDDTTPPTTPGDLSDHGMSFPDGETWLFWLASSDDVDPPSVLRYDVYVNGVFDHHLVAATRTVVYGDAGLPNTFQVIAVDSAGNESAPATLTTTP